MAKAQFIIRKTENENYVFALRSPNGENVGTGGEAYTTKKACENGCQSVRRNSQMAPIEDKTLVKEGEKLKHPKFCIYYDKAKQFRFFLTASNGEKIISSEGYTSKASCKNGIDAIRRIAPIAEVVFVDEFAEKKAALAAKEAAKAAKAAKVEKPAKEEKAKKAVKTAPTEQAAPVKDKKAEKEAAKAAKAEAKAKKK